MSCGYGSTSTLVYIVKQRIQVKISVTCRGRRVGTRLVSLSSCFSGCGQNSGSISAISTYSRLRILSASFAGTGGKPSPTYTPVAIAVTDVLGIVYGSKLASLAHDKFSDGGLGAPVTPADCLPDLQLASAAVAAPAPVTTPPAPVLVMSGTPVPVVLGPVTPVDTCGSLTRGPTGGIAPSV